MFRSGVLIVWILATYKAGSQSDIRYPHPVLSETGEQYSVLIHKPKVTSTIVLDSAFRLLS